MRGRERVPADILFELRYLLTELAGEEVEPRSYSYDPGEGRLCVEIARPQEARICVPLRQCRGLEGPRLERCISKALAQEGPWAVRLREQLESLLRRR